MVERMTHRAAASQFATNDVSRIAYANAAVRTLNGLLNGRKWPKDRGFYFFSVTPQQMSQPLEVAAGFDQQAAISCIQHLIGDRDYLGVLEAAYFSNFAAIDAKRGPTISWHFHLLLLGLSEQEAEELLKKLASACLPLIPGRKGVHLRKLTGGRVVGRALYMLKAPMSEYRVYPLKRETIDPETGEITPVPTGQFTIKKRELRPGDAVKLCRVLGDRKMPDLLFASGQGDKALDLIVRRAQRQLRRQERQRLKTIRTALGA